MPYVLSQRDKNFIFKSDEAPYYFVAVSYPTQGNADLPDPSEGDIVADIRMTRWGAEAASQLTGDKLMDMRKRMAWANLGPKQMAKYRAKRQEASVRKDVKLSLIPMPDGTSVLSEADDITTD